MTKTTPPAESEKTPDTRADVERSEKRLEVEQDTRVARVKAEAEAEAARDKPQAGLNPDG